MHDTFESNFSLKGFTSILIGLYFFIAGSLINSIVEGFLIDDNPMGMLSPQIVEIAILALLFFCVSIFYFGLIFWRQKNCEKI